MAGAAGTATARAALAAAAAGAHFIRVHEARAVRDALCVFRAVRGEETAG